MHYDQNVAHDLVHVKYKELHNLDFSFEFPIPSISQVTRINNISAEIHLSPTAEQSFSVACNA